MYHKVKYSEISKIKISTDMQKKMYLINFTGYEMQTFLTLIKQYTVYTC